MNRARVMSAIGVWAAIASAAPGCARVVDADRSDGTTGGAETVGVAAIEVGDCLNRPAQNDEFADITRVPCDDPHDLEVYHAFDVKGDEMPGPNEMTNLSKEGCLARFEDFVGIPYADSALELTYYVPVEGSWAEGDREVLCLIYEPGGRLTGSMKDADR